MNSARANWRQPQSHPQLFYLLPPKATIEAATPRTLDAFPPFAYLEPTESVAQAPRFERHLIDRRRHMFDSRAWKPQAWSLHKRHIMRNPDPWQPPDREPDPAPATRRAALIGLAVILLLIVGGLLLTHVLSGMSRLQDCALSGRSNCSSNR
jgi:hypothetical protein